MYTYIYNLSFRNAQAIIVELLESKSKWSKNLKFTQGLRTFRNLWKLQQSSGHKKCNMKQVSDCISTDSST